MSSKIKKRFDRLISCVKSNNVERLRHYTRKKKYAKLNFDEKGINKRGETLLHLACRQGKHEIVTFLLENSLGDPTAMDCKGNTALHLALKAIMKIDDRNEYITAYRKMILVNLKEMSASLTQPNLEGKTAKDLLDLADSVYEYHLGGNERKSDFSKEKEEREWQKKLSEELDDEYGGHWGKYEQDFVQEDVNETESYDSCAKRMIHEHKKKISSQKFYISSPPDPKLKPSWTPEDQQQFLRDEKARDEQRKTAKATEKRFTFLSKLSLLIQTEDQIEISNLPFHPTEDVESIGQLILAHIKDLTDPDTKKKALRELQRLWHPDKFSQKFGARLKEEIRESVLKKVTEISQYLNAYNCISTVSNK